MMRCSESVDNFTIILLHNNALDSGKWVHPKREQVLVRDVEFVKNVSNAAVLPFFVRLYVGNYQIKDGRVRRGIYVNPVKCSYKAFPCRVNREFSSVKTSRGEVLFQQTDPGKIQSRLEIMNCILSD